MYINFQATINHLANRKYSTCCFVPIATLLPRIIYYVVIARSRLHTPPQNLLPLIARNGLHRICLLPQH